MSGRLRGAMVATVAAAMMLGPVCPLAPEVMAAPAAQSKGTQKNSRSKKQSAPAKKAPAKKSSKKSSSRKSSVNQTSTGGESSAELKKRQQSAQAEVTKTKEELKKNEQEVKRGLNELSRLEDGIATSKKESDVLSTEVGKLSGKINTLQGSIARHDKELERLRAEYLKAVKKMRVSRKKNSRMAYLFSAKNLAEADRRMRYLKEFSEWKNKKMGEINARVATLRKENQELQRAKSDKDVMLGRELKVQAKLNEQKQRQDVVVAELRANGDALQAHLAKKQSEVNALRNQVAAVIAEEQRKADAERQRREQAAREERERAEQKAAEEAAARKAAEEAAQRQAAEEAEQARKDQARKDQAKKDQAKKDQAKKDQAKKEQSKKDNKGKGDYAQARKRKPRGDNNKKEAPKKETPKKEAPKKEAPKETAPQQSGGDFASMKGSLPRPVGGAFRITGKFGRHALPDLPDVTYDNPGIDAEVASGSSVQSVFGGTVSGVYMVPGFSTVVIVSHGDYYTVYGNIASASVKVGDRVKQGQTLGKLADDPDNPGHSTLHFEVWKGREKQNPQSWIR